MTQATEPKAAPLGDSIQSNLDYIHEQLGGNDDLVIRELTIRTEPPVKTAILYTDSLTDKAQVNDSILQFLVEDSLSHSCADGPEVFDFLKTGMPVTSLKFTDDGDCMIQALVSGSTVILVDGVAQALYAHTYQAEGRSVEDAYTQVVIRGPKEGFTESNSTNISLVRRRIKHATMRVEHRHAGTLTNTMVTIMYIKGYADDQVVAELHRRLDRMKVDGILDSGQIEEWIQDTTLTPFPTVYNTERPDTVAGCLLEGRVAILVDGSPFALIVPVTFTMFLSSPEDYFSRFDFAAFIRVLRYVAFLISFLGPSLYIALLLLHQAMIPTNLLIALSAAREGVPFPTIVEALMMEFIFEIMREAGVRLPQAVGQAVSIVGALVLGQAAVQAGIVSPAMVIIVSITGIANFTIPSYNLAISTRLIRFLLMIFAASFGFLGIMACLLAIVGHMVSLRSFGVPYLSPMAPFIPFDQKDVLLRLPVYWFNRRPASLKASNRQQVRRKGEEHE